MMTKRTLFTFIIVAALFAAIITYSSYLTAISQATIDNSDQANIGIMALRLSDDTVYQRDYLFRETDLFQFYTPLFLNLVQLLTDLTGTYDLALTVMVPVVLFIYLVGMFLFLYQITQNSLVSSLVSLISSTHKGSIAATFWGVAGIGTIMPRTLFLMLVPWLLLLWFRWLEDSRCWKTPFVAFLVGLAANLHPVSGFVLLQILLLMLLLTYGISRASFVRFILSSAAALVGVWPTLTNFLRHSTPAATGQPTAVSFATFYEVLHIRLFTLFPIKDLHFFGHFLTPAEQTAVIWIYLALMLLIGLATFLSRRNLIRPLPGRTLFAVLFAVQLPLAYLLIYFSQPALITFAALYLLFAVSNGPDKSDWQLLAWMILVIGLGYVASYFLDILWKQLEVWSLTSLMGEQMRVSRFIFLPLYAYLARFLTVLDKSLAAGWARTGLIITLGLLVILPDVQMALVAAAFCLMLLMQLRYPEVMQSLPWLGLVLETVTLMLALNVLFSILGIGKWPVFLLGGLYLLARFLFWQRQEQVSRRTAILLITAALLMTGLGLFTAVDDINAAPAQIQTTLAPTLTPEAKDALALYTWARQETDHNSLFYFNSLDFRFRAERSITHSWKDLGIAYYSRSLILPFYTRYFAFEEAHEDPAALFSQATLHEVDYIVIDTTLYPALSLDLPIVFANDTFTVYQR